MQHFEGSFSDTLNPLHQNAAKKRQGKVDAVNFLARKKRGSCVLKTFDRGLFSDELSSGLLTHLSVLLLSAISIVPAWMSGSMVNKEFTAPKDFNQTIQTLENGWRQTPIQGHWHKFGLFYDILVKCHIFFGIILTFLCIVLVGYFCSPKRVRDGEPHLKLRRWFAATWILHLTIAMTMAYHRMLNHGSDPCNWTQVGFYTYPNHNNQDWCGYTLVSVLVTTP